MSQRTPKPLPIWAWILAALFFPCGHFLAYGAARLLSWSRAISFALLSYGNLILFVWLMSFTNKSQPFDLLPLVLSIAFVAMYCAWGFFLYRIGQRAAYWSPAAQRSWLIAKRFAVVILILALLPILLNLIFRALNFRHFP